MGKNKKEEEIAVEEKCYTVTNIYNSPLNLHEISLDIGETKEIGKDLFDTLNKEHLMDYIKLVE